MDVKDIWQEDTLMISMARAILTGWGNKRRTLQSQIPETQGTVIAPNSLLSSMYTTHTVRDEVWQPQYSKLFFRNCLPHFVLPTSLLYAKLNEHKETFKKNQSCCLRYTLQSKISHLLLVCVHLILFPSNIRFSCEV